MKKLFKFLGILAVLLVLLVIGAITFVTTQKPNIPVKADLKVEATPERVARGTYLANNVCVCMDCHSTRDWTKFAGPPKDGSLGVGGEHFDHRVGFPGDFVAKNITPHALKDCSDGELYRAITSGVNKSGQPLFPIMMYPSYSKMATEDIFSIMAYLRTLPAIPSSPAQSKADFPMSVIMHLIPQPAAPVTKPDPKDSVAYGGYVANAASCAECHTNKVKGKQVGETYAGGFEFKMPEGSVVRSPNITPHVTGIGAWTKEQFIARFKGYDKGKYSPPPVDAAKGEMQTVMPWTMYAGMTEQDLGALFDYLHSVKAVESVVNRWSPAVAAK